MSCKLRAGSYESQGTSDALRVAGVRPDDELFLEFESPVMPSVLKSLRAGGDAGGGKKKGGKKKKK